MSLKAISDTRFEKDMVVMARGNEDCGETGYPIVKKERVLRTPPYDLACAMEPTIVYTSRIFPN